MSSGSDSDEEYVPGEPEQLSEEGSADEETDLQYEKELEVKTNKRKAATTTSGMPLHYDAFCLTPRCSTLR